MQRIRRMFPGGNTSCGFYSFQENIIGEDKNFLYILKGMPGGGKSSLMKEIARRSLEEGYSIEYHHCPSDPESIDAIVIVELKIAIVDGTSPHGMDSTYPGINERMVNLSEFIDEGKIRPFKTKVIEAKKDNKRSYRRAFNFFKSARFVYEEIETSNTEFVDTEGLRVYQNKIIEKIFGRKEVAFTNSLFKTRHLFSTAYTPEGYFDYTEFLLKDVGNIWFLDGGIGTGKSNFLKRIVDTCKWKGYDIEIYYSSFIPDKIESIFIWNLDTMISSNSKAKQFGYELIDFNKFFNPSSRNGDDLRIFEDLKQMGIESLKMAKKNHFVLEDTYRAMIDFKSIDREREGIWKEILDFADRKD